MTTVRKCISITLSVLLAAAFLSLSCEGGAICYECNSNTNSNCTPDSLSGAMRGACSRGNDFCASFKKEPSANSSTHQFARYCTDECNEAESTYYTEGRTTKNCILCCKGELCNDDLFDPCNPASTALRSKYDMRMLALLGILTVIYWTLSCRLRWFEQVQELLFPGTFTQEVSTNNNNQASGNKSSLSFGILLCFLKRFVQFDLFAEQPRRKYPPVLI